MARRLLLALLMAAAGCEGVKKDKACSDACDRIIELSLAGVEELGDPELTKEVRRQSLKEETRPSSSKGHDRCVQRCRDEGLDTACVMRVKSAEDAMMCPRKNPEP